MELNRGKQALRASLASQPSFPKNKRTTPREDAKFWCEAGLDKEGLRKTYINEEIDRKKKSNTLNKTPNRLAPDETSSYSMVGLTPSWLPHGKRFGLFATKNFRHGDFLLEYVGSRISGTEAQTRSKKYARSQRKLPRCYLYYFNYKGKQYCLDATRETRGLAKFANDASIRDYRCNAKMKLEVFGDYPRLCLFAIKDIMPGEEIRYDYGEDRRLLFWRQKEEQGTKKPFTEDSDDDHFDVERDRREQATEEPSDKSDIDISDMSDACGNDPEYKPEESESSSSDLTEQADEMRVHDVDGVLNHSTTYCDKGDYIRPSAETSNTTRDFSKQVDETSLHGEDGLFTHSTKTDNDNCDSFGPSTETPTPSIDFSKQVDETSIHGEDGMFTHSTETDNDNCDPLGPSTETPNPSIEFSQQADGTSLHDEDVTEEDSVNGDSLGHSTETSNTTIDLSCHICHRVFKKKGALSTHYHSHGRTKDKPYKKPSRPCFYCGQNQTRLSRHLIGKHAEEALVREALTYPEKSKERQSLLEKIRKQGIYRHNEDQAALPEPVYMSERKGHAEVQCSKCKGFYGSRLFYRHKEICAGDGTSVPTKLKTQIMKIGDGEFESNILSRFQDNAVGHICRSDPSLIFIGRSLYQKGKGKVGKDMEVRKSVMQDMRLLSRLYLYFQEYLPTSTTIEDMFEVKHFDHLERAIEALTKLEGRLKHGVKHLLKYLLHTAHEKLVCLYSRQEEEEKLKRLQLFKNVLKLHEHSLFADATYAININRQEKLRMPEQQAEEEDVERLQVHIKRIISNKCSEYNYIDKHEFVDLRDSLCSRLTLFNARRGGEPSRLTMKQVNDAIAGRWITNKYIEPLPDWEKTLFSEMLVCYQAGKGNRLVPVLIPNDCVKGLKLLSDPEVRKQADILETNDSMFPNTSFSPDHVIGWHCINKMCREAEVQDPGKLTASKQRHRISTIYSSLEVPERERELFYKHMGHSKEVNEGTYQYPLPLLEITKVGRHLQDIDRGMTRVGRIQVSATSTNTDDVQVGVEIEDETDEETITAGPIQSVQQGVRDASEASTLVTRSRRSTRGKEINAVGRIQTGQQVEDASEASTLVTRPNSSTPGKEISTAVHIQLGEDASENSTLVAKPKGPTTKKGKSYFRWTNMETAAIRRDFEELLNIRDGNTLPGSRELQEYVKRNGCRFDHKTLRTKIMNEQNARKKLVKGRMSEMLDKN